MPKYHIDTLFTLRSPLHITEPGESYWNPNTLRWVSGSGPAGGFPCSRTKRLPISLGIDASPNGDADSRTIRSIPYVPGNSLRGGLRRAAANIILEELEKRAEKISFDLYHILLCGAASPSPDSSITVSETVEAGKHPFASLFGGGPKLVWSRSSIGSAYPITPNTLRRGLVSEHHSALSSASEDVTAVLLMTRVDDILRGTGHVPTVILNGEEEIKGWLRTIAESKANKASKSKTNGEANKEDPERDDKKKGLATIAAKEIIIPGTSLQAEHTVDTDFAGEAMLGLFILTLARFANAQRLGGSAREGFGRFAFQASARNGHEAGFDLLSLTDGSYLPNDQDEQVASSVASWTDFAKTLSGAHLRKLFFPE